ncbi:hypothetical protein ARALYDRAFT_495629 [Arabidopsis lyrata subsp. lyrata]|uniref:Bifunctional inhibitor/plant lipid transfer protein/seed storage helical domain-containing protein n=1 Tax=Arabidopsis lyrata subsp. lyrata TaxID=81972 RepID=D7MKH8_ARALL|nr:hypothetical protein ARALYDRAFT_495629 [Arabidopsis lyrata subsp. lyrata]
MDTNNTRTHVKFPALVIVLAALVLMEEPTSIPTSVTGDNPPSPRKECCEVLQAANLECICRFKYFLPVLAVYPSKVQALLSKCGVTTIPPACQGKIKIP